MIQALQTEDSLIGCQICVSILSLVAAPFAGILSVGGLVMKANKLRKNNKAIQDIVEKTEIYVKVLCYLMNRRLFPLHVPELDTAAKNLTRAADAQVASQGFGFFGSLLGLGMASEAADVVSGADYGIAGTTAVEETIARNAARLLSYAFDGVAQLYGLGGAVGTRNPSTKADKLAQYRHAVHCDACHDQIFGERYLCLPCFKWGTSSTNTDKLLEMQPPEMVIVGCRGWNSQPLLRPVSTPSHIPVVDL
ncbi:hypothetical protein HK102_013607 [Quaeritorhiza haematococci]|nr:hypothetical protein HK102_013607 [Quaeritorhiza haematococci]